jgi:hypothetical protein
MEAAGAGNGMDEQVRTEKACHPYKYIHAAVLAVELLRSVEAQVRFYVNCSIAEFGLYD